MKKLHGLFGMVLALVVGLSACGWKPYDVPEFVDIPANATAFVVPLTGETSNQAQFMSEAYLESSKVNVKRIQIPHVWVKTGAGEGDGKYMPTIAVLMLDRTPVSVTWTKYEPGTQNLSATRIPVESSESIGFTIPISLTVMISEKDAAKFLAKYTAGRTLRSVVDTDVNSYIKTQAANRFGELKLTQCKAKKAAVIAAVFGAARDFFDDYGITITQAGMTDGFLYDDDKYQEAIDKAAVLQAESANLTETENNSAKQRQIDIKNAQAKATVAAIQAESAAAMLKLQEVENSRILAQAKAEAIIAFAKEARLPSVLPESSFYKLGLDGLIPTVK